MVFYRSKLDWLHRQVIQEWWPINLLHCSIDLADSGLTVKLTRYTALSVGASENIKIGIPVRQTLGSRNENDCSSIKDKHKKYNLLKDLPVIQLTKWIVKLTLDGYSEHLLWNFLHYDFFCNPKNNVILEAISTITLIILLKWKKKWNLV